MSKNNDYVPGCGYYRENGDFVLTPTQVSTTVTKGADGHLVFHDESAFLINVLPANDKDKK